MGHASCAPRDEGGRVLVGACCTENSSWHPGGAGRPAGPLEGGFPPSPGLSVSSFTEGSPAQFLTNSNISNKLMCSLNFSSVPGTHCTKQFTCPILLKKYIYIYFYIFIYLAAQGFNCGMWNLLGGGMRNLYLCHVGYSFPTRDET